MKINLPLVITNTFVIIIIIAALYYLRPRIYIIPYLKGGLGNQIFQVFAAKQYGYKNGHTIAFARKFSRHNPTWHNENTFKELGRIFPEVTVLEKIDDYDFLDYSKSEWEYKEIPENIKSLVIEGYFQNIKYILPSILDNPPIRKFPTQKNTYFLHIRAGDYLNNKDLYIDLSKYYTKCILLILNSNPAAKFLVFSDDNAYAKKFLTDYPVDYRMSKAITAYDTLIEMSSCTGAICANSSLSWLGAMFQPGRKSIYMPSKWTNGNSNFSGLYPPWATIVSID